MKNIIEFKGRKILAYTGKAFYGFRETHELPIKPGDTVTIKKGTKIRCMLRGFVTAGKTFKIKVHHTIGGYELPIHSFEAEKKLEELGLTRDDFTVEEWHTVTVPMSFPTVCWPGRGGYWQDVDINDIPEAVPNA